MSLEKLQRAAEKAKKTRAKAKRVANDIGGLASGVKEDVVTIAQGVTAVAAAVKERRAATGSANDLLAAAQRTIEKYGSESDQTSLRFINAKAASNPSGAARDAADLARDVLDLRDQARERAKAKEAANDLVDDVVLIDPSPGLDTLTTAEKEESGNVTIEGSGSGGDINVGTTDCRRCKKRRPCPRNANRAADGSRCGKRSAWWRGPSRGYDDGGRFA